ncbi:Na+/solute symporter [Chlorobium limicola DSM 245]|uniref:Na+/solute symporter n=1 Tax=Chlorobium limicola (strain DSM 245 / NBRC 103803 / 6330) TaxID=290315 RepID=B3EEM3_CHLL2|nr:sodium:solute symporter family protein [Chlorobium limicola]ACD90833.1 Na+/solute symporter [Chlorobium limicola DSM 245]
MDVQTWTYIIVGATFLIYIAIAIWAKAGSTKEFYVAGAGVPPIINGMATAADWMSAASFISMAGLISFMGYDGSVYLMGWTGGYVLLALLLAPYLRKFGKFTVPDFVGDRYYSNVARTVAVICAIFVSFTYVAGQMRGVGVVFSRFLEVDINTGILLGMGIVFFYAVLGGMKGITYTQVAQYWVLIFAYMVPAIFLSIMIAGNPIPQFGMGGAGSDGVYLLDKLDGLHQQLGFAAYTTGSKPMIDVFAITVALMVGTAGLPHVIVRFFTVPRVRDARISAGWALIFIALLYTTAPAIATFARLNLIQTVSNNSYTDMPGWFKKWEKTGLLAWMDKNNDGKIQYTGKNAGGGDPFEGKKPEFTKEKGQHGELLMSNKPTDNSNELFIDKDIMVLANPEIGNLPNWVIALVAAGGLAAALSTAAGLLLVISTSISHDLIKKQINPNISEKGELMYARIAVGVAIVVAGYFGINPPGFVAEVVAFAFGLAAASFFPVIILGIFSKRMNKEGAISGMITGLLFTAAYIVYFKFISPDMNKPEFWWFGISPEGIGTLGMLINVAVSFVVSRITPAPPQEIQELVDSLRYPKGAGEASAH